MMVRSRWGAAMVVASLMVVLPLAQARGRAHSGARSAKPSLLVPLPAPGHVTIETLTIKLTGRGRGRLPGRLRLSAPKVRSLPSSVRILYARRTIRSRRATTYRLVLLAINVASRHSIRKARAAGSGSQPAGGHLLAGGSGATVLSDEATLFLFMGAPLAALEVQTQYEKQEHQDSLDIATSWRNADLGTPALGDLISGAVKPVLGANNQDPKLDTGHYDDGHAFGWRPQGEKRALHDITNANLDRLAADLERDMGADINGDGTIGSPQACSRSSRSATTDRLRSSVVPGRDICTTVGPPVVTGGP
jgi:hypothetical protein